MRSQLEDSKAGGWKDLETGLLTDLLFEVGCQLGASDLSTWPPHAISLPGPVAVFSQHGGWVLKARTSQA